MIEKTRTLIEKYLKQLNVKKWDVLINKIQTLENQFRGLKVEITRDYEIINYNIRIFNDRNENMGIGIVKGSSLNEKIIEDSIIHAKKMAQINSTDKYELTPPGKKYKSLNLAEKIILSDPFEFLQNTSEKLTSEISNHKNVDATFGKFRIYIHNKKLINNLDLDLDSESTSLFIEYAIKSELNGELAEYWAKSHYKNSNQLKLDTRVAKWAKIASDTLKAKHPQSNKSTIVLFPPIVLKDAFRNTLGYHITGKSKVEKISRITVGEKFALESLSMNDNGIIDGGLGSNSWDGEGIPQRNKVIIENGIFKSRIYDLKHAKLLNNKSTGNGIRTSAGSIENSYTNLEILPGTEKLEDMISQISDGIIIEEFSWLNPNKITGDFGAEIRNGYMIKKGKIGEPIKGGNLSGNIFEMVNNILNISIEREFEENTLFPYIVCKDLILSS